ncbi:MAG: fructose permease [Lactobacillus sp.]|uniref:Sugar specific permease n=2 Tax=Lentilactobacillus diolivorans TaxID=179838 RepID=A0A0R1SFQ5_9LACO|nr:hypothetical protein [Lentilactobacillus diolivorans]KRL65186.1 sugar specific permease [Lentilactobacillus diolivorans DSM 14421]RRG02614.1 MAG: fructose permease [Lactobacillus sp.]
MKKNQESKASPSQVLNGRTLSMSMSIFYFVVSLVINSAGNVLTLVTSAKIHPSYLGSAYWTAAEANLSVAFGWNLFWTFLILGVVITILNAILVGHWDWRRALGNLIFMVPFSALIQIFEDFFIGKYPIYGGLPAANTPMMIGFYILLNFFGVALIGTAISIYQRVNLVLHPADDLMQILRFKYFKGNANIAMWASYIPPTLMAILAFIITKDFTNLGIGTIFAFLFQGGITGIADTKVIPSLKHQALDVGQK